MYVIEALPRHAHINALDSCTVVYMDSGKCGSSPYIDTYDRKGELWRSHIYWLANRDRLVPDAKIAIYPFKRSFVVGAVSTDVQSGEATMCYLPGGAKRRNTSAGTSTWARVTATSSPPMLRFAQRTYRLRGEVTIRAANLAFAQRTFNRFARRTSK